MLDGIGPVAASSFTFSTSDTLGTAFAFEAPRVIAEGGYAEGLATDGQDVLAYWTQGDLFFAVSRDGGATFAEPVQLSSGFDAPYVGDVRVALRNGTAHVFWRVLPENGPGYAFYARLDNLTLSHGPTLFMPEEDDVNVVNVGMGSDGGGNLRVAWSGPVLCGDSICPPSYGVWAASSPDGGETWVSHGRVEPESGGSPEVVWTESGFLTAWLSDTAVRVFDQNFIEVVALSVTGGDVWPFILLPNGSDDALLSWRESKGPGASTTYLSLLLEGSFTPAQAVYTEADDRQNSSVRFAPTRTDDVGMLQCIGRFAGAVERSVSVSVDRGHSFHEPQELDFLRAAGDDPRGEDQFCPAIALDADGRLHLLWERYIEDPSATGPGGMLYARGEPVEPCSW
jgi:hypothetical protein